MRASVGAVTLVGKSTRNRPEHASAGGAARYHKIGHDAGAVENVFVDLAHDRAPGCVVLDLDATDAAAHAGKA